MCALICLMTRQDNTFLCQQCWILNIHTDRELFQQLNVLIFHKNSTIHSLPSEQHQEFLFNILSLILKIDRREFINRMSQVPQNHKSCSKFMHVLATIKGYMISRIHNIITPPSYFLESYGSYLIFCRLFFESSKSTDSVQAQYIPIVYLSWPNSFRVCPAYSSFWLRDDVFIFTGLSAPRWTVFTSKYY